MKRAVCLIAVLCVAASVPRPALADRDDIDELLDRYVAAYNRGDAEAMAVLYSDDAVLLPHEERVARGRSKIEQFWRRTLRFDPARRMGRSVSTLLMAKKAGSDVAYLVGTSESPPATPATSRSASFEIPKANGESLPRCGTPTARGFSRRYRNSNVIPSEARDLPSRIVARRDAPLGARYARDLLRSSVPLKTPGADSSSLPLLGMTFVRLLGITLERLGRDANKKAPLARGSISVRWRITPGRISRSRSPHWSWGW